VNYAHKQKPMKRSRWRRPDRRPRWAMVTPWPYCDPSAMIEVIEWQMEQEGMT